MGVLNTLATQTIRISDEEHLDRENDHLTKVFKSIGYKNRDIRITISRALEMIGCEIHSINNHNPPSKTSYLPYIKVVTVKISKVSRKKEIMTSFKPLETIRQQMR
jgi:hypothetical protein